MGSSLDTQSFSPIWSLVLPMSTIPLAMLQCNTFEVYWCYSNAHRNFKLSICPFVCTAFCLSVYPCVSLSVYVVTYVCRPVARIFRRGVTQRSDVYIMHKHACKIRDLGASSHRTFLEIRCSEIASEAIFGHKMSYSSDMALGLLHSIFGCPCLHLISQLNLNKKRY